MPRAHESPLQGRISLPWRRLALAHRNAKSWEFVHRGPDSSRLHPRHSSEHTRICEVTGPPIRFEAAEGHIDRPGGRPPIEPQGRGSPATRPASLNGLSAR